MSNPSTTPDVFVLDGSASGRDLTGVLEEGCRGISACMARMAILSRAFRSAHGAPLDVGRTMRDLHARGRLDGFKRRRR